MRSEPIGYLESEIAGGEMSWSKTSAIFETPQGGEGRAQWPESEVGEG